MPDLLIRDFPAEDLELLDDQARKLGLSRAEFLRRHLHEAARRTAVSVTHEDLAALGGLVLDLDDPSAMGQAWS